MDNAIHCDIVILGGGAGGLSLAAGAAQLGINVVLLEGRKMGGDCLNYGCVPSKSLIAAGKSFWQATHSEHFGVNGSKVTLDFQKVMAHVHHVIATIAPHDSVERFSELGVRVIPHAGHFVDAKTVEAGEYRIQAKRFIIATGSSPAIPPIPGLSETKFYTNETIFSLETQPSHLLVVGGGPIGCELAQAFAMLGTKVTLFEGKTILPKDEPDCVAYVRDHLIKTGVDLKEGIQVKEIASVGNDITVVGDKSGESFTVKGSHLLIATGRRANVQALNLEKAGIDFTVKGVVVNKNLKTTNKKVYAIGDAAGGYQFTHVAGYHAGLVIKNYLFRLPLAVSYNAIPWVTYTEPQLAHVGLTTTAAKQQGIDILVTESLFEDNDRAQTEADPYGKIKILTDKKGRILGATIVSSKADDLLLPWVIAVNEKKTMRSFTDAVAPYPTYSEISKRVAGQFYTKSLFSPKVRSLVRWLQKLG